MNHIAEEIDVKNTVDDFLKFCDFVEREKPFATAKGDLSIKACYEINKLLHYPKQGAKITDKMHQYESVYLWFTIAREINLITSEAVKGGKNVYVSTEKYVVFKKMNIFTQYIVIFYAWYCFVDAQAQYKYRGLSSALGAVITVGFAQLAKNDSERWIERDKDETQFFEVKGHPVQVMMRYFYNTACNLRDLGFIVFEDSEEKFMNQPIIERVKPTDFGAFMSKTCEKRPYVQYNLFNDKVFEDIIWGYDIESGIESGEENSDEVPPFITPFLECFPQGSIDIESVNAIIFEKDSTADDRVFDFTVSLNKSCYRVIRCSAKHTFDDLHSAIQEAFEFDDDHLYSFYLDGKCYSEYAVNSPYSEMPPYSDEVSLGSVRLKNKQQILYLFDYGDNWQFKIVLNIKHESDIVIQKPEIIKSVGEAPEQYPYYD